MSGAIEKSRLLSLRQFVHVYKEIIRQSSIASQPSASGVDLGGDALSMLYVMLLIVVMLL